MSAAPSDLCNSKETVSTTDPMLGDRYTPSASSKQPPTGQTLAAWEAISQELLCNTRLIQTTCLCGQDQAEADLSHIDKWGFQIRTVLCTSCGLIRLNPRWDNATYRKIYESYYWPLQAGQQVLSEQRFRLSARRAAHYAEYLKPQCELNGKRVLEIGCSFGAGLVNIADTGAQIIGFDYDERFIEFGRRLTGLDLRIGGIDDALRLNQSFEIIILRHVLEHFLYPIKECEKLKQLMGRDSILFIEVPGVFNLDYWSPNPVDYFQAFHIHSFTLQTLKNLMNSCGFQLLDGNEHVYSLWRPAEESPTVQWCDPDLANKVLAHLMKAESTYIARQDPSASIAARVSDVVKRMPFVRWFA